jgi:hypothetical protein
MCNQQDESRCDNCKFFELTKDTNDGICHNPNISRDGTYKPTPRFPEVRRDSTCGLFTAKST